MKSAVTVISDAVTRRSTSPPGMYTQLRYDQHDSFLKDSPLGTNKPLQLRPRFQGKAIIKLFDIVQVATRDRMPRGAARFLSWVVPVNTIQISCMSCQPPRRDKMLSYPPGQTLVYWEYTGECGRIQKYKVILTSPPGQEINVICRWCMPIK